MVVTPIRLNKVNTIIPRHWYDPQRLRNPNGGHISRVWLLLFLERVYKVVFKAYITYLNPLENGQCESLPKRPLQPLKRNLQPKKPRYLLRPTEQKGWWVRFLCQTKMTLSFHLYHTNHTIGTREPRNLYGSPLGDYNHTNTNLRLEAIRRQLNDSVFSFISHKSHNWENGNHEICMGHPFFS